MCARSYLEGGLLQLNGLKIYHNLQWILVSLYVITLGYIKELDDKGRLIGEGNLNYGVTDKECDEMEEMCDPYEGL